MGVECLYVLVMLLWYMIDFYLWFGFMVSMVFDFEFYVFEFEDIYFEGLMV